VVCRPDCADLLTREGLQPVPFDNAFLTRRTPIAFLRTVREAWRLRRLKAGFAIDPDADPRSALWLRIAGAARVFSYRRDFGTLFDETFALPPEAIHQADRDMAVAEEFLRRHSSVDGLCDDPSSDGWGARGNPSPGGLETSANDPSQPSWQRTPKNPHTIPASDTEEPPNPHRSSLITHHPLPPWLLSVWTRKPAKNWPLERWSEFMERLQREGVPFAVLHAPDGDSAFQLFRARWSARVTFVEGDLGTIADSVSAAAGVIATDNFLGHMAGYYGKPVLWVNICSPAAQVEPRGPRTVRVQAGDEGHHRRPGDLSVDAVSAAFAKLRMPPST
jgi:ADP-heptose:LPS heptosyltransferase